MVKEIEVIRYLLDEMEERNNELLQGKCSVKSLISDNARKVRKLSLKIAKEVEAWNFRGNDK